MGGGKSKVAEPKQVQPKQPALTLSIPADELNEKGIHMETIEAGDDQTFPQAGNTVLMTFKGYLVDGKCFGGGADQKKQVGKGKLIKGMDTAMLQISKGQHIHLAVAPHLGYGDKPAPFIPPNSILLFDITLHDIVDP
eukprot:NODE_7323_length_775_cov_42.547546_g7082_i0.p1 GENE.NODE_7323_length_775_cov_42.547546_g7082_i0~~NODE_7323_length_775_cov_42.547546_g7082_i0.p1  ORF type:complete len:138 (+),score=26.03 NODE_7323_length_775_cov_42.547546_g7082_i0:93-506(+)